MASSPFVYLPDYSGIAFLHVWNAIQEDLFPKGFCSLIEAAYQNFWCDSFYKPKKQVAASDLFTKMNRDE